GETAAGRPGSASDARKAADGAVRKAKDLSAKAAGGTTGDAKGNGRTDSALDSAKAADRAMKQARSELGKGNTAAAKGLMDKAEKDLRDVGKNLSPDGSGDGEGNPGGKGGGKNGDVS